MTAVSADASDSVEEASAKHAGKPSTAPQPIPTSNTSNATAVTGTVARSTSQKKSSPSPSSSTFSSSPRAPQSVTVLSSDLNLQSILNESDSDEEDGSEGVIGSVDAAKLREFVQMPSSMGASSKLGLALPPGVTIDSSDDEEEEEGHQEQGQGRAELVKVNQQASAASAPSAGSKTESDGDGDDTVPRSAAASHPTPPASAPSSSSSIDLARIKNPLTRAELLEQRSASNIGSGSHMHAIIDPLDKLMHANQPVKLMSKTPSGALSTASSISAANLVKLVNLDGVQRALEERRAQVGLATACCLHSKFIGIGTSRGTVLVFNHFETVVVGLGKSDDSRVRGGVTCIDINASGDAMLVGYSKGFICVWDLTHMSLIKMIADPMATAPICTVKFTRQEASTKVWQFFTADKMGCLNLYTITKQLFNYGLDKQILLQGKAGAVLASALLFPCLAFPHLTDHFGLLAIATESVTSIIALEPQVQIVYRVAREAGERVGVLPCMAWRPLQARDEPLVAASTNVPASTSTSPSTSSSSSSSSSSVSDLAHSSSREVDLIRHPILALCRGRTLSLLQAQPLDRHELADAAARGQTPKIPVKFVTLMVQSKMRAEIKSVNWLANGTLLAVILAPSDEIVILDPFSDSPLQELASVEGKGIGLVHAEFFNLNNETGPPVLSYANSIHSTDGSTLMLGSDKVSELHVLPWSDRLEAFSQDGSKWMERLALALHLYHGSAKALYGLSRDMRIIRHKLKSTLIELIEMYLKAHLHGPDDTSASASAAGGRGGAHSGGELDLMTGSQARSSSSSSSSLRPDRNRQKELKLFGGTCIAFCLSMATAGKGNNDASSGVVMIDDDPLALLFGSIYDQFKYLYPHSFVSSGLVLANSGVGSVSPVSLGSEIFLEILEGFILNDQLPWIPNHILADMFALYQYKNRLDVLEQMMLHLDPTQLDLNFVLPLVRGYRLFSAIIYFHNKGRTSFDRPLMDIWTTIIDPPSNASNVAAQDENGDEDKLSSMSVPMPIPPLGSMSEDEKQRLAYKLLLYIDYTLRGKSFPVSPSPQSLPRDIRAMAKAQVLSVLFRKDLSIPHSTGVAVHLPDYPFLSYFLNLNAHAFLTVLARAFEPSEDKAEDWTRYLNEKAQSEVQVKEKQANETKDGDRGSLDEKQGSQASITTDQDQMSGHHSRTSSSSFGGGFLSGWLSPSGASAAAPATPTAQSASPATKGSSPPSRTPPLIPVSDVPSRQQMFDALLFLILDQLQSYPDVTSTVSRASLLPFTYVSVGEHRIHLFRFAARYLSMGYVTASKQVINRIFTHLCSEESEEEGLEENEEDGVTDDANLSSSSLPDLTRASSNRQEMLLSLLGRVPDDSYDVDSLLARAHAASFHSICIYLYLRTKKDFTRALDSFIRAIDTKDSPMLPMTLLRSARTDAEKQLLATVVIKSPNVALFDWIHYSLQVVGHAPAAATLRSATLQRLPELVKADSDRTARLILHDFTADHDRVVNALNAFPQLQFQYLSAIMNGRSATESTATSSVDTSTHAHARLVGDGLSVISSGRLATDVSMSELVARSGLKLVGRVHELYIRLLCQFQPHDVLPHLSTHADYDIDRVLKLCQEYHVDDASAFLLERTGNQQGALELTLQAIDRRLFEMRKVIEENWRNFPFPSLRNQQQQTTTAATNTTSTSEGVHMPSSRRQSTASTGAHDAASSSTDSTTPSTLDTLPSYQQLNKHLLNSITTATLLCQRNGSDEHPEKLWFALLDRFVSLQRTLKIRQQEAEQDEKEEVEEKEPASRTEAGRHRSQKPAPPPSTDSLTPTGRSIIAPPMDLAVCIYLQSALYSYVRLILSSMMAHLDLVTLLTKLTRDHADDNLRDFRETIQGLLDTHSYEASILRTANKLLASDNYHSLVQLHQRKAKAMLPSVDACGCCGRPILDHSGSGSVSGPGRFTLFDCGHIFDEDCLRVGRGSHAICMLCQRDTNASSGGKKRSGSSRAGTVGDRRAMRDRQQTPTNEAQTPLSPPPSKSSSVNRDRDSDDRSTTQSVHRLILAERKLNKTSQTSTASFQTKLRKFGRGGADLMDETDEWETRREMRSGSNPFSSGPSHHRSSSSSSSSSSNVRSLSVEADGSNFQLPSLRTGPTSLSASRQPGQMGSLKPQVVRRMNGRLE